MQSILELAFGALLGFLLLIPLVYTYTQWEIKHSIDLGEVYQRLNDSVSKGVWPRIKPGTASLEFGRDKYGTPTCRLLTGEEGTLGVISIDYWDNREQEEVCDIHVFGKKGSITAVFINDKIVHVIRNNLPVFEVNHQTTYLLDLILGITRRVVHEHAFNQP